MAAASTRSPLGTGVAWRVCITFVLGEWVTIVMVSAISSGDHSKGEVNSLLSADGRVELVSLRGNLGRERSTENWRWRWQGEQRASVMEIRAVGGVDDMAQHAGGGRYWQGKSGAASPEGLPWAPGPSPPWLLRSDRLVVDARQKNQFGRGMLMVMVINMDSSGTWEPGQQRRPRWLRAMLAANIAHVEANGHALVIRWQPTSPQLTDWQLKACEVEKVSDDQCVSRNERENINWEKHLMLLDYLHSHQNFSHVFMLDADAVLLRRDHDTMQRMATILETENKNLFAASEDWLKHGEERLNGGVLLAQNVPWSRDLFQDLWDCHRSLTLKNPRTLTDGPITCGSNEMAALNEWRGRAGMKDKIHLASGIQWNRGGETLFSQSPLFSNEEMFKLGMNDPDVEIMHFMGGAKGGAAKLLCDSQDLNLTGERQDGYGCSN
eukprot:TRINITY_DN63638_c0_g1_i1.p1 TRINITY_DN63638_c0_g1~~TRINITY_DN63638_c0_g1_i1.p1  ORF type:complete len:464 (-),score=75.47 TRINITY_DN63638_c0_g1_i1:8-1318(-)